MFRLLRLNNTRLSAGGVFVIVAEVLLVRVREQPADDA
jgi:hypothetical protein